MNRGNRPVQQNAPSQPADAGLGAPRANAPKSPRDNANKNDKLLKIGFVVLSAVLALLLIAVLVVTMRSGNNSSNNRKPESSFIDKDKFQAVFLNGGQVYFGKVTDLNSQYLSMNNIYYLRVNQQVQPEQANSNNANDISLVKLGCELHGPQDSMVINREQVIFWENLKTDGQVAKAVDEYVKANPNGQKCETAQNNNNSSSNRNNDN